MLAACVIAAHLVLAWALSRRRQQQTTAEIRACASNQALGDASRREVADHLAAPPASPSSDSSQRSLVQQQNEQAVDQTQHLGHPYAQIIEQLSVQPPPLHLPPGLEGHDIGQEHHHESCVWVSTVDQLKTVAQQLSKVERVALDVEHHSTHSYAGLTCLVQLSTGRKDYLVDAIALRQHMHLLGPPVLSNPRICKVVHGGGNDCMWLQRDFPGLYLVNCFDTEKACQILGYQQRSLGHLLQRFCGIQADKGLGQRADWRQRPLPSALLEYAQLDVHYLCYIADCLGQALVLHGMKHLPQSALQGQQCEMQRSEQAEEVQHPSSSMRCAGEEMSGNEQCTLQAAMKPDSPLWRAVHRSQALTLTLYQPTPPAVAVNSAAMGLLRRVVARALEQHARLTPEQLQNLEAMGDCVHALAEWRDAAARSCDEGVQCLLPDSALVQLAEAAASRVAPHASNLRGRQQKLDARQLVELLPAEQDEAAASAEGACCYPRVLLQQADQVADLLSEAALGQRPWMNPDLQQVLHEARGGGGARLLGGASKASKQRDPAAFKQRLAQRFAAKGTVYENCRMYSQEGELLCYADAKKLLWYVQKGLAVKLGDNPLSVRLTFEHQTGDQQQGISEFYTVKKANKCVACGEEGHYLRYRVVPTCYRRAMPVRLKSHRSHDVVLLCISCHELAHKAADRLKRQLASELGVPLLPPLPRRDQHQQLGHALSQQTGELALVAMGTDKDYKGQAQNNSGVQAHQGAARLAQQGMAAEAEGSLGVSSSQSDPNMHPFNVRRAALALNRHGQDMPDDKRRQLVHQIRRFLGTEHLLEESGASEDCLTELEQYGGLLAGLGRKTRRRMMRRWVEQGQRLPQPLAAEAAAVIASTRGIEVDCTIPDASAQAEENAEAGSCSGGGPNRDGSALDIGLSDLRNTGHLWHGQQVVEQVAGQGGDDALLELCRRFRQCFVDALQPQHLPAGWAVYHSAKREFGKHSIYHE